MPMIKIVVLVLSACLTACGAPVEPEPPCEYPGEARSCQCADELPGYHYCWEVSPPQWSPECDCRIARIHRDERRRDAGRD